MARVATSQTPYLVLFHQLSPHGNLVRRRIVDRVENVLLGPDVALRMLMAIDAPTHVESVLPPRDRHLSKLPMARCTTDSFADMNTVIEIHKVGKRVHPVPQDRLSCAVAGAHRFQHRSIGPQLRMARHAGVCGRYTCIPGILNRSMAVPAIDAQLGRVVLMAERNRLRQRALDVGEVRRLIHLPAKESNPRNDEYNTINAGPCKGVHAAMKNLRHCESLTSNPAEYYPAVVEAVASSIEFNFAAIGFYLAP